MSVLYNWNPAQNCNVSFDFANGITFDTSGTAINGLGPGGFTVNAPYGAVQIPGTTVLFVQPANNQSTGATSMVVVSPTINQTGSASYNALAINVTETGIGSGGGNVIQASVGGSVVFQVSRTGVVTTPGQSGGAGTLNSITKTITGIAEATATSVVTVTIPNAANGAVIDLLIVASLGAGGAVGQFEASAELHGSVVVTRTPGLATAAAAATAFGTTSDSVVGGATITLAYSVSAISGANTATQTFTIQVTITAGSGSSTNHSAIVRASCLNNQASGITIS
jgi:hypothetical protein